MGFLVFLLILALIAVTVLYYRERERHDEGLEHYARDMLDEHQNLTDGLRELREAEEEALHDMEAAARDGR